MASWVTHLMIADKVMKKLEGLDRHGFCVGNIAPDCNVENEDWTSFTPPKQITHWMNAKRKAMSDVDAFCKEYIIKRKDEIHSAEQYSFLLGYYSHLITDASYQEYIRNPERVKRVWDRIMADDGLREKAEGYPRDYDSVKKLLTKEERMSQIQTIEAEYLRDNQDSGYLTDIMCLKEFPDYIDYLPHGCIARKVQIMGYIPQIYNYFPNCVDITKEEYQQHVNDTVEQVIARFKIMKLI